MTRQVSLCLYLHLLIGLHTCSAVNPELSAIFWKVDLGLSLGSDFISTSNDCSLNAKPRELCRARGGIKLTVTEIETNQADVRCSKIVWLSNNPNVTSFEDCLDMRGAHWYGGTSIKNFTWPIENWSLAYHPYVTSDQFGTNNGYAGVQERYWMNSNGTAFIVDWNVPLWVSFNGNKNNKLCFKSTYLSAPYWNYDNSPLILNYTVCQGDNVRHIHGYVSHRYIQKPKGTPEYRVFKEPIWSTGAYYKAGISQELIMKYAGSINAHELKKSHLEIDEMWESKNGDMTFDPIRFPNPSEMINDLAKMGFRTTLSVCPLINLDSVSFGEGTQQEAFVMNPQLTKPVSTKWSNGLAAIIDVTSISAASWFLQRILKLKTSYNISSVTFAGGESSLLPPQANASLAEKSRNPSIYSTRYVELANEIDKDIRHQNVRVGARTQHLPIFISLKDRDSVWGTDNGLKTLIPNVINYGLIGYPFIIVDTIAGNAQNSFPNKELFIRWLEACVLLPSLKFSIPPWHYDNETISITKKMLQLRDTYSNLLLDLADKAITTGAPIICPIWWIAPLDEVAQTIDSEYLVGSRLLIAPVLDEGSRARDVYLPAGLWYDELRNETVTSSEGKWLRNYPVELDEVPYFSKVD